jgi:hypothetical protein
MSSPFSPAKALARGDANVLPPAGGGETATTGADGVGAEVGALGTTGAAEGFLGVGAAATSASL